MARPLDTATLCAHAGPPREPVVRAPHSHVTPLYQNSVFDFGSIDDSLPALSGDGYVYARLGLPNTDELGQAVAALEGADAGFATSSGMGAIASAVLSMCSAGDRVLVQSDAYGGSHALLSQDLARLGIQVVVQDVYETAKLSAALSGAKALLVESVANPLLHEPEIPALYEACRQNGVTLIVDNTFATPLRNRVLRGGGQVVVHSVTKFLGGHHDLCAGVVVGDGEVVAAARGVAARFGLMAAPFDAWLAVRGMRTLAVRMERAWATCAALHSRVGGHPAVKRVFSAERCALFSFDVGDQQAANRVVEGFELITLSPSLGGVTTTVSHPASSSHKAMSPAQRVAAGISDGLLRISVGLESVDDLWADLERGLSAARPGS